jgi:hypothetical protein
MTCPRCLTEFDAEASRCPRCGEPNRDRSGVFQSSTVMISAGGAHRVYRSVDEIPGNLRSRLVKSTNGRNSATILIADRRGREEIARLLRQLPGSAHRRLARYGAARTTGLTRRGRTAILALLVLAALAAAALVFANR